MPSSDLPLTRTQLRWILAISLLGFFWKTLSLRSPFFLLPQLPPLPMPHTCIVHYPEVLRFCEDFASIPGSSMLVLSCDPERREWSPLEGRWGEGMRGGEVWIWDPEVPDVVPVKVEMKVEDFRPLGISVVMKEGEEGVRVFVVNQALSGPRVEVVDVVPITGATKHVATIQHPVITSPNGIAAVSADGFFVSNDVFFTRASGWLGKLGLALELVTGVPGGGLVFVSLLENGGVDARKVATLAFGNGVAVDASTHRVWAASLLKGVYEFVYSPDGTLQGGGAFTRSAMLVDNLIFSPHTNTVFASGVTSLGLWARSMASEHEKKPESLVARLVPRTERGGDIANVVLRREEWRWETVFADDGVFFGGVSSGAVIEGGRFVGVSLLQSGVVVCGEVPVRGVVAGEEVVGGAKDEL